MVLATRQSCGTTGRVWVTSDRMCHNAAGVGHERQDVHKWLLWVTSDRIVTNAWVGHERQDVLKSGLWVTSDGLCPTEACCTEQATQQHGAPSVLRPCCATVALRAAEVLR
jgi:hypothetical protein